MRFSFARGSPVFALLTLVIVLATAVFHSTFKGADDGKGVLALEAQIAVEVAPTLLTGKLLEPAVRADAILAEFFGRGSDAPAIDAALRGERVVDAGFVLEERQPNEARSWRHSRPPTANMRSTDARPPSRLQT